MQWHKIWPTWNPCFPNSATTIWIQLIQSLNSFFTRVGQITNLESCYTRFSYRPRRRQNCCSSVQLMSARQVSSDFDRNCLHFLRPYSSLTVKGRRTWQKAAQPVWQRKQNWATRAAHPPTNNKYPLFGIFITLLYTTAQTSMVANES